MKLLLSGIVLAGVLALAQTPASEHILRLTATTANVSGAPDSIRIDVLRWSTDAERDQLMAAWNMTAPAAGRAGRGGRGGAGRGGGGGRGGRGGEEAAAPATPESTLAAALEQIPTVGYLWSSEVAGYALRYAGKVTGPDGGERIILITDRRLGNANDLWKPAAPATASAFEFSVLELRLNAKGDGEGKTSLTGKVTPDTAAKILALENYDALPVILKNVKHRPEGSAGK
jgi:hypothetical protein